MKDRTIRHPMTILSVLLATCCGGCVTSGGATTTIGDSVSSFAIDFVRQVLAALLT